MGSGSSRIKTAIFIAVSLAAAGCGAVKKATVGDRVDNDAAFVMAVLGDSVASGMFADTTLGKPLTPIQVDHLATLFKLSQTEPADSEDFYLAAQKEAAAPDASAFSGVALYSLSKKLQALLGESVGLQRYAISGARAVTMKDETDRLASDRTQGYRAANLVVVHIGANDYCDAATVADFVTQITARLNEILAAEPIAKILVAGIPDVPRILTFPDRDAFSFNGSPQKCSTVRDTMKLCAARDLTAASTAAEIAMAEQDRAAMNDGLAKAVSDAQSALSEPGRIAFAPYDLSTFDESILAIDCFHPGSAGHAAIADAIWPYLKDLLTK